ncbi:MAG: Maf family protein [Pacificimonas sp.]
MTAKPLTLVLASSSRSRRDMLTAAGVSFEAVAPNVDEAELKLSLAAAGASPRAMADALAEAKAIKVGNRRPDTLVLGSDQILALADGSTMDKAEDMATLKAQLQRLSNETHRLIAAAVIVHEGRAVWRHADTAVMNMRALSDDFIDNYLAAEGKELLWGVGGYRIERLGAQLFARVVGDQFTVRGLPLFAILGYLRERGVLPQ